jgi:hypothetical protein
VGNGQDDSKDLPVPVSLDRDLQFRTISRSDAYEEMLNGRTISVHRNINRYKIGGIASSCSSAVKVGFSSKAFSSPRIQIQAVYFRPSFEW